MSISEEDLKKVLEENQNLKNIIIEMTHHDGAVKEMEEVWGPIVDEEFKRRLNNRQQLREEFFMAENNETNIFDNLKQHELLDVIVDPEGTYIEHVYREPSNRLYGNGSPVPDLIYKERYEVVDGRILYTGIINGKHNPGYFVHETFEFEE
jgi:hypothetical protein